MGAVVALNEIEQMIDSQGVLEVVAIQVVLLPLEPEPEECLKTLYIGVNRAGIWSPWNALQNQKAAIFFDQAFGARLPNREKSPQNIPSVRSRGQTQVFNGHDEIHMQAAQQLALRVTTAITV
jgi:hypothetical protein